MRTMGRGGMVASPQYLATQTGVNILRRGGNAVDAAIATNAVLAVVTPYVCGLGGDLFAIVYTAEDGRLAGLNASGRAPLEATPERVRELAAGDTIPTTGPLSITVPGCVDGWARLHERYGRLPMSEILEDAIRYAGDGFPVSAEFSRSIDRSARILHPETPAAQTFLPGGSAPREGSIFRYTALAATLRAIAERGPDVYYRGDIGREMVRAVRAVGGLLSEEDLAEHLSDWVEPLSIRYRDIDVYELPPNSQGIVALMMLNLLQYVSAEKLAQGGEEYVHLLAEVTRLAYADREAHVTDLDHMRVTPEDLLSDEYARSRAAAIGDHVRGPAVAGYAGDTVYLCTADSEGNLVSLIESNFMGIGSGVMAGSTGIMLQNRGSWFSLDPTHANVIAPRKRTMHTLMPGMAFRDGKPWLVFGTMGGSMQAQIHVQLLTRLIDQHMPLDEALSAPRFDAARGVDEDGMPILRMEGRFDDREVNDLHRRGHAVELLPPFSSAMGHAHAIRILDDGVYVGASDPRTDSLAVGY